MSMPSPVPITLWHKALILIGVPLLFEYIFVVGLIFTLAHTAELEHEKKVLGTVLNLGEGVISCGKALALYLIAGSDEGLKSYEQNLKVTTEELEGLQRLLPESKQRDPQVRALNDRCRLCIAYLNETKRLCDIGDRAGAMEYMKHMRHVIPVLEADLNGLTAKIRQKRKEVDEAKILELAQVVLLVGLVGSSVIALSLAILFHRGTANRLRVLMDNTKKMESGATLNPPIAGLDEVSELDRVFHKMARSVTESTAKLRASEAQIRSVIENMPVGVVTAADDGTILSINPKAEEMFAQNNEAVVGTSFVSLIKAANADSPGFFKNELVDRCLGSSKEFTVRRSTGGELPVEISISDLRGPERTGLLIHVQDRTERQEMERLKSEFMAMVTHDLRTPLTSLRLTLQLIAMGGYGEVSEKVAEKLQGAEINLERLVSLINDLLDAEKLQAGKFDLDLRICDLLEMFERARHTIESFAQRHKVQIKIVPIDVDVRADADRVVQVLVNLLSNAIKFSPQCSTVKISAESLDKFVTVQVSDEGRGIPPEKLPFIFERFRQVETDDAKKKGGTGLGLSICKSIVEEHGGRIGVTSEPGQGSTFWFQLPLA